MTERTVTFTQAELEAVIRESYERGLDPPEAAEAAFSAYPPPATPGLDVERLTRALGTAEVGCYYRPITHDARIDDSIHYTDAIAIAREYAALAETPGESLGHSEQCQRIGGGPGHDQCICWCHGYER